MDRSNFVICINNPSRATWIEPKLQKRHGIAITEVIADEVKGDSMRPKFEVGDVAVLDGSSAKLISGQIYLLAFEDKLFFTRVLCDRGTRATFDNMAYPDYALPLQIKVVGRVIARQTECL